MPTQTETVAAKSGTTLGREEFSQTEVYPVIVVLNDTAAAQDVTVVHGQDDDGRPAIFVTLDA